jgi:hypothetical protein
MELTNSKNIHNRIKKRTVAMAVITHIYLAIITVGGSLLLLAISGYVTSMLLKKILVRLSQVVTVLVRIFRFVILVMRLVVFNMFLAMPTVLKKMSAVALKLALKRRRGLPWCKGYQLSIQILS